MQVLLLYQWSVIAAMVMGPVLSVWGTQVAARELSAEVLCLGQAATLGVIVGMMVEIVLGLGAGQSGFPFLFSFLVMGLVFVCIHRLSAKFVSGKATFFIAMFSLFIALGQIVSSFFAQLENHLTQVFFGDLATLSNMAAQGLIALGIVFGFIFILTWRKINLDSFQLSTQVGYGVKTPTSKKIFDVSLLILIAVCVQNMGFLYTMGSLFIPTTLLRFSGLKGLKSHLVFVASLSLVSSLAGFTASLLYPQIATVPAILCTMFVGGVLPGLISKSMRR